MPHESCIGTLARRTDALFLPGDLPELLTIPTSDENAILFRAGS